MKQLYKHTDNKVQQEFINVYQSINTQPIGSIVLFCIGKDNTLATNADIPPGWLVCNGNDYAITQYPLLFQAIGQSFGNSNVITFKVPSLTPPNANTVYGVKF